MGKALLCGGTGLQAGRQLRCQFLQQGEQAGAAIGQHLAHQQVYGLDFVGTFVNHGHAGVAHDLLNAPLAHITVAAKHLQAFAAAVKGLVGKRGLDHRRDQRTPGLSLRASIGVAVVLDDVQLYGRRVGQHAAAIDPGALAVEDAAHGRVLTDQVSLGSTLAAPRRAHLAPLLRVGVGLLPGRVQQANALQRHVQARGIHHHEHGVQALADLADDPALGFFKAHDAGRAAVQAHLFFDAVAMGCTARAIGIELGHQKQRQPLGPGRCIGQTRQHQVHDVVGQVVLAAGDKNLGAADHVTAVLLRHGAGARQSQIAAGMRLGQAHGGQPFTGGHFFQVLAFELCAGMVFDAFIGAMQQARCHGPAVVGGAQHFVQRGFQHGRQSLSAVFGRAGESRPAALPEALVGIPEARRHGDLAGSIFLAVLRAHLVANALQRCNHFADKLGGFFQHLLHQVGIHLGVGRQALQVGRCAQHVLQDELDIGGAGLVVAHAVWLSVVAAGLRAAPR